jgi:hypothetical protein
VNSLSRGRGQRDRERDRKPAILIGRSNLGPVVPLSFRHSHGEQHILRQIPYASDLWGSRRVHFPTRMPGSVRPLFGGRAADCGGSVHLDANPFRTRNDACLSGMAATSVVHPSTLCVLCVSHRHASICSLQISLSAIEITLTVPLDHASWHLDTHFARRAAGPPRLPKQSPSHIGISAPGSRIPPHLSPTTQWPGHKVPESQRQWWHHIYTPPDLRPTVRLIG